MLSIGACAPWRQPQNTRKKLVCSSSGELEKRHGARRGRQKGLFSRIWLSADCDRVAVASVCDLPKRPKVHELSARRRPTDDTPHMELDYQAASHLMRSVRFIALIIFVFNFICLPLRLIVRDPVIYNSSNFVPCRCYDMPLFGFKICFIALLEVYTNN